MQKRQTGSIALLAVAILGQAVALSQTSPKGSDETKLEASAPSRDLSGTWDYAAGIPGQGIFATLSKEVPPMTAWAQARWDAAMPGYGPKAVAVGNDPILKCTPSGLPRILTFPEPFEIVQTPGRVFMFFEREHAWRQIWTDGRGHAKNLVEPTWMGDSIGRWDGDTFIVESRGFNDRAWLDAYGHPHSEEMHLVERYRRVDQDTLLLDFTVEDPKAYSRPWTSDVKILKLVPKEDGVMEEIFCVAEDEEAYRNRIRLPAAGVKPTK